MKRVVWISLIAMVLMGCQRTTSEYMLGLLAEGREEYQKAAEHYTKALEGDLSPQDTLWISAHFMRSTCYLNLFGEQKDSTFLYNALDDLSTLLSEHPDLEIALLQRGALYQRLDRYDSVLVDWGAYLQLDTLDAKRWWYYAGAHQMLHHPEEALACVNRAIQLEPGNDQYVQTRASYLTLEARYDEAMVDFNNLLAKNPESAEAWCDRSRLFALSGQLDSALSDINHALEIDSTKFWFYGDRAYVLRKMGDLAGARRDSLQEVEMRR